MLVQVLDAQGVPHTVAWQGQDQINDASGALGAGNIGAGAAFLQVLAANPLRAGWLFQNTSPNAMFLNELSDGVVAHSWVVNSGEAFPPCGYPIPTTAISVVGGPQSAAGDTFACREWVNAVGE